MKFTEIIDKYNIPRAPSEHHHQTEGWINLDCPFCSRDSHRYRMGYNISGGFTNCWVCGPHSLFSVVKAYTDLPNHKVKELLDQLDDVVDRRPEKERGHLQIPNNVKPLTAVHIKYLESRGYDYKEIQKLWDVQAIGISGRLSWRLFIPIHYRNKTVSWTTRAIGKCDLRYISAKPEEEVMPHKNMLYGLDYVRDTVIICEGPLDVWSIGPGAVATFGTSFTSSQIKYLVNIPKKIVCYDNEYEAQKQALKLCNMLGVFGGETINVQLDSKDPGEANIKELKKLRKFLEN